MDLFYVLEGTKHMRLLSPCLMNALSASDRVMWWLVMETDLCGVADEDVRIEHEHGQLEEEGWWGG